MFANKNKVSAFTYSIDMSTPVNFFCQLVTDMCIAISESVAIENVFEPTFLTEIEARIDTGYNVIDIAPLISLFYDRYLLNNLSISKSAILFIYKPEYIVFAYDIEKKSIKNTLATLVSNQDLFKILLSNLKGEKLKLALSNILNIKFFELFQNVIHIGEEKLIFAPYMPFGFFNDSLLSYDVVDIDDLKINHQRLKKELGIALPVGGNVDMVLAEFDGVLSPIGIKYADTVFPLSGRPLHSLIKPDYLPDYYWLLFKEVFSEIHDRNKGGLYEPDIIKKFKSEMQQSDLNALLTYLHKNHILYQKESAFEKYSEYFEEVSTIGNLASIEQFDFYVSDTKGATALGVYTNNKIGSSYNLLHWVNSKDQADKFEYYRDVQKPESKAIVKAYVLKPAIAFYFLTNYFEDLLERAIADAGKSYIKNFVLFVNNDSLGETDFLIRSGNKLIFVEAKTKLTDIYIDQYVKKCDTILTHLKEIKDDIEIDFFIIGALSDKSCENKRYFINQDHHDDYNVGRTGLKTVPYYFKVPIPRFEGRQLTCIAEPDYSKLMAIIKSI